EVLGYLAGPPQSKTDRGRRQQPETYVCSALLLVSKFIVFSPAGEDCFKGNEASSLHQCSFENPSNIPRLGISKELRSVLSPKEQCFAMNWRCSRAIWPQQPPPPEVPPQFPPRPYGP